MDKADKEAERARKTAEKQAAIEAQVKSDYEAKVKNGKSGTPTDQLKVWLDNAPFRSQDTKIKRDTMFNIMSAVMALKQKEIDDFNKKVVVDNQHFYVNTLEK